MVYLITVFFEDNHHTSRGATRYIDKAIRVGNNAFIDFNEDEWGKVESVLIATFFDNENGKCGDDEFDDMTEITLEEYEKGKRFIYLNGEIGTTK